MSNSSRYRTSAGETVHSVSIFAWVKQNNVKICMDSFPARCIALKIVVFASSHPSLFIGIRRCRRHYILLEDNKVPLLSFRQGSLANKDAISLSYTVITITARDFQIISYLSLYLLYNAEACNEFDGPISASLRIRTAQILPKKCHSRWQKWRAVGNTVSDSIGPRL